MNKRKRDLSSASHKGPPPTFCKTRFVASLGARITDENLEDALLFAELKTVKNIEAVVHGLDPIIGGRSVLLNFTAEQFAAFSAAILANGAIKNGEGFVGKEAALVAALGASRSCRPAFK